MLDIEAASCRHEVSSDAVSSHDLDPSLIGTPPARVTAKRAWCGAPDLQLAPIIELVDDQR